MKARWLNLVLVLAILLPSAGTIQAATQSDMPVEIATAQLDTSLETPSRITSLTDESPAAVLRTQSSFDCATATGLPQTECEALVAIYNATGGDDWYTNTDWLQTTTPCTWYGVTCEVGHITRLELPNNNLIGALASEIGDLSALTELDLGYTENNFKFNALTSLPAEIGNLTALTTLDLGYNNLTSLPAEIGNLTTLITLELRVNQLTSLLPEIGDLLALVHLDLTYNRLATLPPEIGNLTTLTYLTLQANQLTTLPPEIGNLTALTHLHLGGDGMMLNTCNV
jgi:Leucine-rich repeat (LRR) protein